MAQSPRKSWPGWPKEGGQTLWPALSKFLNGSIPKQSRLSGWLGPPAPCQPSLADQWFVYPIGIIARVDRTRHMLEATRSSVNGAYNIRVKNSAEFSAAFSTDIFRRVAVQSLSSKTTSGVALSGETVAKRLVVFWSAYFAGIRFLGGGALASSTNFSGSYVGSLISTSLVATLGTSAFVTVIRCFPAGAPSNDAKDVNRNLPSASVRANELMFFSLQKNVTSASETGWFL